MKKAKIGVLFFLLCTSSFVFALSETAKAQLQTCQACHGEKGVSSNPEWPHLAGQHAPYISKQLADYKNAKNRFSPIMNGISAGLTPADIADIAEFYASLPPPPSVATEESTQAGQILYRSGDRNKGITACIACHGPTGRGNSEAGFPALAGQPSLYLLQQLTLFKQQKRSNDLNGIMRDICQHMDKRDMQALALYLQALK